MLRVKGRARSRKQAHRRAVNITFAHQIGWLIDLKQSHSIARREQLIHKRLCCRTSRFGHTIHMLNHIRHLIVQSSSRPVAAQTHLCPWAYRPRNLDGWPDKHRTVQVVQRAHVSAPEGSGNDPPPWSNPCDCAHIDAPHLRAGCNPNALRPRPA